MGCNCGKTQQVPGQQIRREPGRLPERPKPAPPAPAPKPAAAVTAGGIVVALANGRRLEVGSELEAQAAIIRAGGGRIL